MFPDDTGLVVVLHLAQDGLRIGTSARRPIPRLASLVSSMARGFQL